MGEKYSVRIIKSELKNFKNVQFGEIKYRNYGSVENDAELINNDIMGIYGQNGSGKTAMVEALDILKSLISGGEIEYSEYEGMLSDTEHTKITTFFYVKSRNAKYKVKYEVELQKALKEKKIQIHSEKLTYWERGATWKGERSVEVSNPFYNSEFILGNEKIEFMTSSISDYKKTSFVQNIRSLAIYCAQRNVSIFFNDLVLKSFWETTEDNTEGFVLAEVIKALFRFGSLYFQVIKVKQLGVINNNMFIPVNIHSESENMIRQGCLPLFMNGHDEVPKELFQQLQHATESINIAIKAIIPNLSIELVPVKSEINKEGNEMVQVDAYSVRGETKFLTKYESEGIKRIISLLNYLIALYNYQEVCLVVDELDSGIFEYLLGELLGVLREEAKGQLIFTSHNLRIMEKLDKKNIVCTTTNPDNRYIVLTGIEKNNNRRDFYIRSIVLGGQKETLYDDTELQSIGYAFRQACVTDNDEEMEMSRELQEFLREYDNYE